MPSLVQIKYAMAIEKCRSFSQAARSCNIAQPSLSMQVQKMEDEIGFSLFDRKQKPILPTEKGVIFLQQAHKVLNEYECLMQMCQRELGQLQGSLKVEIAPTIISYLVPTFINDFSENFPSIRLIIEEQKTSKIISDLENDTIDAAIVGSDIAKKGFKSILLYLEPLNFYAHPNHPLLKNDQIALHDLNSQGLWLLKEGHMLREKVKDVCGLKNQAPYQGNFTFEGDTLESLRKLIKKREGYTLVPDLFTTDLSDQDKKTMVRSFHEPQPYRKVSLIFRREKWKSDMIKELVSVIKANLPQHIGDFTLRHTTAIQTLQNEKPRQSAEVTV